MTKQERQDTPQGILRLISFIGGLIVIGVIFILSIFIVLGAVIAIGEVQTLPYVGKPTLQPVVATIPLYEVVPTVESTRTALPIVIVSQTPVPAPTCVLMVIVTSDERARIRSGPGLEYKVIDIAEPLEVFSFETYNGDSTWIRIGIDQWIFADLLSEPRCV